MKLLTQDPNLTIILPVSCQCKCSFCFWNNHPNPLTPHKFIKRVKEVVTNIPDEFQQVSVSGGEPTMFPKQRELLNILSKRFNKIVYSTNGYHLNAKLIQKVNHVNVSRHHYKIENIKKIFDTHHFIDDNNLCNQIKKLNVYGIDVTLVAVIGDYPRIRSYTDVFNYIKYASRLGASAVTLRADHSLESLEPSALEKDFYAWKPIRETGCPVCRTKTQLINGMYVNWTSALSETTNKDGLWELILQPNGILTDKWQHEDGVDDEFYFEDVEELEPTYIYTNTNIEYPCRMVAGRC